MKKKAWIIAGVLVLCALCVVVGIFFWADRYKLNADEIDRISLWNASLTASSDLKAEDAERFVELFNKARYAGKGTGEGGTPDWSVSVYCKDGTRYQISEHGQAGSTVQVQGEKAWFYVESTELKDFILELMEKY